MATKKYGMIRKRRKFYNKFYNLHSKKPTKKSANEIANKLRKQGWNVKITKDVYCHYDSVGDFLCDQVYVIYVRRK